MLSFQDTRWRLLWRLYYFIKDYTNYIVSQVVIAYMFQIHPT